MRIQVQRGILCLGLLLIAGSGLYAPWNYTFQAQGISQVVKPAPRAWLFSPTPPEPRSRASGVSSTPVDLLAPQPYPRPSDPRYGVVLAVRRLVTEWIVIGAATGAALVILHSRREDAVARTPPTT